VRSAASDARRLTFCVQGDAEPLKMRGRARRHTTRVREDDERVVEPQDLGMGRVSGGGEMHSFVRSAEGCESNNKGVRKGIRGGRVR
jgi:hypothetical protein